MGAQAPSRHPLTGSTDAGDATGQAVRIYDAAFNRAFRQGGSSIHAMKRVAMQAVLDDVRSERSTFTSDQVARALQAFWAAGPEFIEDWKDTDFLHALQQALIAATSAAREDKTR